MRCPPLPAGAFSLAAALLAIQAAACARPSLTSVPASAADARARTSIADAPPFWWPGNQAQQEGALALGEPEGLAHDELPPPLPDAPPPIVPGVVAPHERRLDATTIPDGEACLQQLVVRGIAFHTADEKRGVTTPVVVDGPLGGVVYRGIGGAPFLGDCRLAVALSWVGPDLLALGVTEAWFSGVYSYRMARVGRLSLHAYGLAIDIHELTVRGKRLSLTEDYERGTSDLCASEQPLNRIACGMKATGLFREMLTPDTDADHLNHFHWSIVPLGEDPVRRVPARPETTAATRRGSGGRDGADATHPAAGAAAASPAARGPAHEKPKPPAPDEPKPKGDAPADKRAEARDNPPSAPAKQDPEATSPSPDSAQSAGHGTSSSKQAPKVDSPAGATPPGGDAAPAHARHADEGRRQKDSGAAPSRTADIEQPASAKRGEGQASTGHSRSRPAGNGTEASAREGPAVRGAAQRDGATAQPAPSKRADPGTPPGSRAAGVTSAPPAPHRAGKRSKTPARHRGRDAASPIRKPEQPAPKASSRQAH